MKPLIILYSLSVNNSFCPFWYFPLTNLSLSTKSRFKSLSWPISLVLTIKTGVPLLELVIFLGTVRTLEKSLLSISSHFN